MKPPKSLALLFAAVMILPVFPAKTAPIQKLDNNNPLNQGTSWNGGVAPGAGDVAAWDLTVATAANCTNALTDNGLGPTWGGIQVLNPAAPITILTNTTGTPANAISLGGSGIDLSSANVDLTLGPAVNIVADQAWNIASGRTLTCIQPIAANNNLTVNGRVIFQNTFIVTAATLTITNANALIEASINANSLGRLQNGATVNQTAGTLKLGTVGGGNITTLGIGQGAYPGTVSVYNLSGGQIIDTNSQCANARVFVGNAADALGILNISGTGYMQVPDLRIGAATTGSGIVNITNGGTLVIATNGTIDPGELSVGRGGNISILNVYSNSSVTELQGNMKVGNGGTVAGGSNVFNVLGGTVTLAKSLMVLNSGIEPAIVNMESGTMTVTNNLVLPNGGGTDGGPAIFNLDGGILTVSSVTVGSGVVTTGNLNLNGGTLRARVSGGLIANDPALLVYVLARGAVIDSAGFDFSINAALLNGTGGGADGGLTKLGAGTLTLANANTYTGGTTISEGTLALTGASSIATSTNISIAAGAAFDVSALSSTFVVGSSQTLGNSGSTATLRGNVDASSGTLSFQYASGTPSLEVADGTLTLSSSTTVKIDNTGAALAAGSYKIVSAATGSVAGTAPTTVTVGGNGLAGGVTASLSIDSGNLYLVATSSAPPAFGSVVLMGTNLVSTGTNGPANGTYRVLSSTSLTSPLKDWTPIATNSFDASGYFIFTNVVDPAKPVQFYGIAVP